MNRRMFLAIAATAATLAPLLSAAPAIAGQPEIFTGLQPGVAVGGYDPVAYFSESRAVKGNPDITAQHAGVEWRFASAGNRDLFLSDPERYAPQFGGYCAYAVAKGGLAKGEPEVWRIVDGKLYLNFSKLVQGQWLQDVPGHIDAANRNWPSVLN